MYGNTKRLKTMLDNILKDTRLKTYIGKKVWYDKEGQMIFCKNNKGGNQLLLDVRGWGNIQLSQTL